jgi:peptidoglycan/xylan/chitin deacetylase (PgdA/CDA1 family)
MARLILVDRLPAIRATVEEGAACRLRNMRILEQRQLRGARNRLLVLGFHNIESTWCWPAPAGEGARTFLNQLKILDRAATVVPLKESLDTLAAGGELPPRAVALTFDDGYRDNLMLAAPMLRRFGMPATIYLVPGFLDRSVDAWWERLGWAVRQATAPALTHGGVTYSLHDDAARGVALRAVEDSVKTVTHAERTAAVEALVTQLEPSGALDADGLFLDWDLARGLPAAGMTVGSHTIEHPILSRETPADQRRSLRESKSVLEREIGVEVETLAYPNGTPTDYDETTLVEVGEAGYSYAVTTWGAPVAAGDPPFEIHRSLVGPCTGAARFSAFLAKRLLAG